MRLKMKSLATENSQRKNFPFISKKDRKVLSELEWEAKRLKNEEPDSREYNLTDLNELSPEEREEYYMNQTFKDMQMLAQGGYSFNDVKVIGNKDDYFKAMETHNFKVETFQKQYGAQIENLKEKCTIKNVFSNMTMTQEEEAKLQDFFDDITNPDAEEDYVNDVLDLIENLAEAPNFCDRTLTEDDTLDHIDRAVFRYTYSAGEMALNEEPYPKEYA